MRQQRHMPHLFERNLRRALLVTAAVVLALTACARMETGTARSQPPRVFPNLDGFTAVDGDDYKRLEHSGNTVYFQAPNGIRCSLSGYLLMTCSGVDFTIPEVSSGDTSSGCTGVEPTVTPSRESGNTYRFFHRTDPCLTSDADAFKPLPAKSKVSLSIGGTPEFTCGVDTDLVACISPAEDHGFVLSPQESWVF